jgi:hypothetical protein
VARNIAQRQGSEFAMAPQYAFAIGAGETLAIVLEAGRSRAGRLSN